MFSLTLEGHAEAVRFVKSFGLPMLVSGIRAGRALCGQASCGQTDVKGYSRMTWV